MLRLVVLDPGGTCGLLYGAGRTPETLEVATAKCALAALPARLYEDLRELARKERFGDETLLVYETFTLRLEMARQQCRKGSNHMPSSIGIGVLHGVALCIGYGAWTPIGVPPGCKTGGHQYALKHLPTFAAAYVAAKNDHERDVCDLASFALRQRSLGKAPFA